MNFRLKAKSIHSLTLISVLMLIPQGLLFAQVETTPPREEAEKTIAKGIEAAKQKDWDLAIKYFMESQERQPSEPRILFNVALASDKAGNRETIAIPWYQAYLAAAPDASNREVVEKRIVELDVQLESRIRKLLVQHQDVVNQLDASVDDDKFRNNEISFSYGRIALAQYAIGDLRGALETLGKMYDDYNRSEKYQDMALDEIERGDLDGARKIIEMIEQNFDTKVYAYWKLAEAQIEKGNRKEGRRLLSIAQNIPGKMNKKSTNRYVSHLYIAHMHATLGDHESANKWFEMARGVAKQIKWPFSEKHYSYAWYVKNIALEQAGLGYIDESKASFDESLEYAKKIDDDADRNEMYIKIAIAYSEAGYKLTDYLNSLLLRVKDWWIKYGAGLDKDRILVLIANAEMRIFDIVRAKDTISNIGDEDKKSEAWQDIAEFLAEKGDISEAQEIIELVKVNWRLEWVYKRIASAQAKKGDYRGARETADNIDDIEERFKKYKEIADMQMKVGKPLKNKADKVAFWSRLAKRNNEMEFLVNIGGYLQSMKNKETVDALKNIVLAMNVTTNALKEIRQMKAYWN